MRIASEGIPFVAGFLLAGAAGGFLVSLLPGVSFALAAALTSPLLILGVFSAWFFRDPDRAVPAGSGLVLAPADGRIVAVVPDPTGPSLAIFLSVFDVHVNRSPVAGRVESVAYRRGDFLAAFDERAGELNEQNEVVLAGPAGTISVRQIAGFLARRIVCRVKEGDNLGAGERFGLIRFGSRTDLILPPGAEVLVKVGDRVRGGETVVARTAVGVHAGALAAPGGTAGAPAELTLEMGTP